MTVSASLESVGLGQKQAEITAKTTYEPLTLSKLTIKREDSSLDEGVVKFPQCADEDPNSLLGTLYPMLTLTTEKKTVVRDSGGW